jgi:hypothetical protein
MQSIGAYFSPVASRVSEYSSKNMPVLRIVSTVIG